MRPHVLPVPLLIAASAAALLASPAPAGLHAAARTPVRKPVTRSPDLWATINVCDTAAKPDTIGVRGSMPGLPRGSRVLMRFQVQYLGESDGVWHDVERGADSGWKDLGRLRSRVVESGHDFRFQAPPGGGADHLRGVVRFRWVRGRHVVQHARRLTEAGHRSTAGADPPGYSAATCDIT